MSEARLLLTGFQPYGGRGTNPAFELMRRLDNERIAGMRVTGRALPVSLREIGSLAAEMIDEIEPDVVLSLGLWPGEAVIRVERIAVNIADFEIPDNDGVLSVDAPLDGAGAAALLATVPVRQIEAAILAERLPARISATAGTYLCNACLYSFLKAAESHADGPRCGFLHVPYLPEQVADLIITLRKEARIEWHQRKDVASMNLDCMSRAVRAAIAACATRG